MSNIKRKKTRMLLGHVSQGHGRIGMHRKPGWHAPSSHQLRQSRPSRILRNFHLRRQHKFCPTLNLNKLWSLVGVDKVAELQKQNNPKAPVIDLVKFGYYHKLLGHVHLPHLPVIVKAKYFTKKAENKIKSAGGACLLVA